MEIWQLGAGKGVNESTPIFVLWTVRNWNGFWLRIVFSNKKLLVTSASLLVTSALLLVVTRSY